VTPGKHIPVVDSALFFGVILDAPCIWNSHPKEVDASGTMKQYASKNHCDALL
jgi:hypothetical protein